MDIEDYVPEFYELNTADGRRFLSYRCFKCNNNHLIRTTSKEISKIRASFRIVKKNRDDRLLLHCGKGEAPDYDGDGIQIVLMPKSAIPKPERDKLRKKINRIIAKMPQVYFSDSDLISTETLINQRLEYMENMEIKLADAKVKMEEDLKKLKKVK